MRGGVDHSCGGGLVWSSRGGEIVIELNPLGGGKVPRNHRKATDGMAWDNSLIYDQLGYI